MQFKVGRFINVVFVIRVNPVSAKYCYICTMQFVKHKLNDRAYAAQEIMCLQNGT